MNIRLISSLILLVILAGCATGYQQKGFTGGFSETQLDTNAWTVTFNGNAYTSKERAADFTLLRCAELALENGYGYFVSVESESYATTGTYTTPSHSQSYGSATANSYGNTTYIQGSSHTTTHGGQTYHYSKPGRSITMVAFAQKPSGFSYNANLIRDQLTAKYGIDKE